MMDAINHALSRLLVTQWAVPAIVGLLMIACLAIIGWNYLRHHRGLSGALEGRLATLEPIADADDVEEARQRFTAAFANIDAAMRARDGSPALVHAWLEYAENLVDPAAQPIQSTTRPDEYFLHLGDDTRVLAWWANLFVAFGLTFTFLGIIAALTATTDSIRQAGADASHMSGALITLLTLTAAKFWTSIAGVVGSIVLRFVDRRWHSQTLRRLGRLVGAIERGTSFVPGQRLAAYQLRELERQSTSLDALPAKLGEAIGRKLQPVVSALGGNFDRVGQEMGAAISRSAGAEMEALAATMAKMAGGMEGVHSRLEDASGAAGDQIANAAREFSAASEQMTQAFGTLNARIDGMAETLAVQAAEKSSLVISTAFAAFGQRFEAASAGLIDMLHATSDRMEGLGGAIERSTGSVSDHAARLGDVGRETQGAASLLGRAANDLQGVAGPIRDAASTIEKSVGQSHDMLRQTGEQGTRSATAMQAVAASLERTGGAAEQAWASYADRFEGVDEALASALERIKGASAEHAKALNEQVGRIDDALAQSVDRLHAAIAALVAALGRAG